MHWRQHLQVASAAVRRGMITDAVLLDALAELARRLAVSGDELWVRSRRLTAAQLNEVLQAGEHLAAHPPPEPVPPPARAEEPTIPPQALPPTIAPAAPEADEPEPPSSRFMTEAPKRRERYAIRSELGAGGMGRVIECEDQELGRSVALKAVRGDMRDQPGISDHLEREARLTAGLEHPNIIPVYDAGRKANVGPYYVMRLVRQPSLELVLERLRADDSETAREYSLGRLLRAFIQICHAVDYAHDRGVIHCDLKPANILLGDFGEVLIVDWGMAIRKGERAVLRGGTPGYMAPEQFFSDPTKMDARTDVFALGAILYEITCLEPAFDASQVDAMVWAAGSGASQGWSVVAPSVRAPSRARPALDEICLTALAYDSPARYPSARSLGKSLEAFVEGTRELERRRRRADQHVAAGDELSRSYFDLLDSRPERVTELEDLRAAIAPHEDVARKRELWDAEDRVSVTDRIAIRTLQTAVSAYEQALENVPSDASAKAGLFQLYLRERDRAKARRNDLDRAYFESLARQYRDIDAVDLVEGAGSVTVESAVGDVFVEVQRFEMVDRRLVGTAVGRGQTPVTCQGLRAGPYAVRVGQATRLQTLPFVVAPGCHGTITVDPVAVAATAAGELYVAGGPALLTLGGSELREVDIPAFYIDAFPVTFAEYLAFLTDLTRRQRELADDYIPTNGDGEPYWELSGDTFVRAGIGMLGAAHSEIVTWPVFGVPLRCAEAFAAWKSARTGKAYRLPTEPEWEKAARGIDGRTYPWGDAFDATFCKMRESRRGRPRPERPGAFQIDESPYGVRDMAGGIAEWTAALGATKRSDEAGDDGGEVSRVAVKGGAWCDWAVDCDVGARRLYWSTERAARVGFRLIRSATRVS